MKMKRFTWPVLALLLAGLIFVVAKRGDNLPSKVATHSSSAIILVYHRFGEDQYPATNIKLSQFKAQLNFLKKNHFHVWPLEKILDYLKSGSALPKKVVAITIDDAYRSVYTNAWPLLKQYHFPFAVFVATQPIDHRYPAMMSWKMLAELTHHGVTIGNHSTLHRHFPYYSIKYWSADAKHAENDIEQHLHVKPTIYAYPYGEYTRKMLAAVRHLGFSAALAQYSAVAHTGMNFYSVPRFSMNEHYGNLKRFEEILNTKSLSLKVLSPTRILIKKNPPVLTLRAMKPLDLKRLHCYATGGQKLNVFIQPNNQFQLKPAQFKPGRIRISCTYWIARHTWRWFGMQLLYLPPKPLLMKKRFDYDLKHDY